MTSLEPFLSHRQAKILPDGNPLYRERWRFPPGLDSRNTPTGGLPCESGFMSLLPLRLDMEDPRHGTGDAVI